MRFDANVIKLFTILKVMLLNGRNITICIHYYGGFTLASHHHHTRTTCYT